MKEVYVQINERYALKETKSDCFMLFYIYDLSNLTLPLRAYDIVKNRLGVIDNMKTMGIHVNKFNKAVINALYL